MKKVKFLLLAVLTLVTLGLSNESALAEEVKEKDNTFYIVESGDTLSSIAEKYGVDFTVIHGNNEDEIEHADIIDVGQKFLVKGKDFDEKKVKEYKSITNNQATYVETYIEESYVETDSYETAVEVAPQVDTQPVVSSGGGDHYYAAKRVAEATGTSVDTWLYIIYAESSNNPTITNSIGCYGYFQIHPVHGMPQGASVDTQIEYAIKIYNSQGFGAWEVMH